MLRRLCSQNSDVTSVIRSIPELSMYSTVAPHIEEMKMIRHAGAESYAFKIAMPPAFRTEMHFARRHVYRLKNVRVNPRTGACRAGGNMFQESYGSLNRCLLHSPFPALASSTMELHGPTVCVNITAYYHFLLEEVPRILWTMEQYPAAKVLVADNAPVFARQILDLLVSSKSIGAYETVPSTGILHCDEYVFTQAEAYSGFIHSTDISLLLKHIMVKSSPPPVRKRKVYISRKNSSRAFDNESEIEEMLKKQGYDVVYSERFTFAEQITLFQSALMVVAGHGAGLANLIWCQPGSHVIELFSPRHFNDCYARLSMSMRLNYQPLMATASRGWGKVDLARLEEVIVNA